MRHEIIIFFIPISRVI